MFKKRRLGRKKKRFPDVRRRPIERLPFMPQQITDVKETVGVRRKKFIPYATRTFNIIPTQPSVLKTAGKRKISNLQELMLAKLLSEPLNTRRDVYEVVSDPDANNKIEDLLKKQKQETDNQLRELDEKISVLSRAGSVYEDPVSEWVRTSGGYQLASQINPITLEEKQLKASDVMGMSGSKQEEQQIELDALQARRDVIKEVRNKLETELGKSEQDRTEDLAKQEENVKDLAKQEVDATKANNQQLRRKKLLVVESLKEEPYEVEDDEEYNELISKAKELSDQAKRERLAIDNFQNFIDKLDTMRGTKSMNINMINGYMNKMADMFGEPMDKYKFKGDKRTLTGKQAERYRLENYEDFIKLRNKFREMMIDTEKDERKVLEDAKIRKKQIISRKKKE